MADRVTKKLLTSLATQIAPEFQMTGDVSEAWDSSAKEYSKPFMFIHQDANGLYYLKVGMKGGSGETHFGSSTGRTAREMEAYLRGIMVALRYVRSLNKEELAKDFSA